jgi:biopolymer transport protein ExbB/TolQ
VTETLGDALYQFTQALMPLVLGAVAFLGIWCLVMLGAVAREWLDRWRNGRTWRQFVASTMRGDGDPTDWAQNAAVGLPLWLKRMIGEDASLDRLRAALPDAERFTGERLAPSLVALRVGPMLGLAGTLIPLGPALQGLAAGDTYRLATNLNLAFTTTIFGILVGAVAFAVFTIRRVWYERDLAELELVSMAQPGANRHE